MSTVFTKIIDGELPGRFVWSDDVAVAFLSINPLGPGHTLVVPRAEVDQWVDADADLLAHLTTIAHAVGAAVREIWKPTAGGGARRRVRGAAPARARVPRVGHAGVRLRQRGHRASTTPSRTRTATPCGPRCAPPGTARTCRPEHRGAARPRAARPAGAGAGRVGQGRPAADRARSGAGRPAGRARCGLRRSPALYTSPMARARGHGRAARRGAGRDPDGRRGPARVRRRGGALRAGARDGAARPRRVGPHPGGSAARLRRRARVHRAGRRRRSNGWSPRTRAGRPPWWWRTPV